MLTLPRMRTITAMHTLLKRSFRSMIISAVAAAALFLSCGAHAQQVSYILPDIGTPGMATYIEGIGPADLIGNFGPDGLYLNAPGSAVRLECVDASDTHRIIIGPVIVSWGGRMFSSQIFVAPFVRASSHDWREAPSEDIIPLRLTRNGTTSNTFLFRIVRPYPALHLTGAVVLGEGTNGIRSPRGAQIFESLTFTDARVRLSTDDCDSTLPGNQGHLPAVLLIQGDMRGDGRSYIDVSAIGRHGGPGGGGGGGSFCFGDTSGVRGGEGFTAGGRGGRVTGDGQGVYTGHSSGSGYAAESMGASLNGQRPGFSYTFGNAGGGTGHPFGQSGSDCDADSGLVAGGRGGGSGTPNGQVAGNGGNGQDGGPVDVIQHGRRHGSRQIVPLAGGSGGASGTPGPNAGCGGVGGGGGGAIRIYASRIEGMSMHANGGAGIPGTFDSMGASGSGGSIHLTSKQASDVSVLSVVNGIGSDTVGAGRLRIDGEIVSQAFEPTGVETYSGPSTDTTAVIKRSSFILTGTGDGNRIRLYLNSASMPWTHIATVFEYQNARWTIELELPGNDQLYYLVAVQENPSPHVDWYLASPRFVMSQAAANIFRNNEAKRKLTAPEGVSLEPLACGAARVDTIILRNTADSPLTIREIEVIGGDGLFVPYPERPTPCAIPSSGSLMVLLRLESTARPAARFAATLRIHTDDMALPAFYHDIRLEANIDSFSVALEHTELNFGIVDMCGNRISAVEASVRNDGSMALFVEAPRITDPDITLEDPRPADFPLELLPGHTRLLRFVLKPSYHRGRFSGLTTMRAYSGSCSRDILLPFTADTDTASLEADHELAFGALTRSQFPVLRHFAIRNSSQRVIRILQTEIQQAGPFIVRSIADSTILPGMSTSIAIECIDPSNAGRYDAVLAIVTTEACTDMTVNLNLRRLPLSAFLSVEDVAGSAGDTVLVRVVAALDGSGTVECVIPVHTMLNVPASLLVPITPPYGIVDGDVRRIPLTIEIPAFSTAHTATFPFLVTLGVAESAAMTLGEAVIEGTDAEVQLRDGRFRLDEVCHEGGSRLFDGRLRSGIQSVYPNPPRGFAVIAYMAIERGMHSVELYDASGKRLSLIDESFREPGHFLITLDTEALEHGAHVLLLTTPSRQYAKLLMLAR
jgi:hypothetical protein